VGRIELEEALTRRDSGIRERYTREKASEPPTSVSGFLAGGGER
jgi:hypothetical protein